jgi:hypothetical protein
MMLVEEEAERLRDEYERAEQDMRDELDRLDALNDGLKQASPLMCAGHGEAESAAETH